MEMTEQVPEGENDEILEEMPASCATDEPTRLADRLPQAQQTQGIELYASFSSFIALRSALDKYQKENHVQLIVKDSKLLSADSTRRVIPKVYHLVNQNLMYHSITYCCKCHGALKQKPGSRIKNIGSKRLNCPMYIRFKLSPDLQSLVLFDMLESHNHPTDPNTFQLSPRQQIYRLSRLHRGEPDPVDSKPNIHPTTPQSSDNTTDLQTLISSAIRDVNSVSSLKGTQVEPSTKSSHLRHGRVIYTTDRNVVNDDETHQKNPDNGLNDDEVDEDNDGDDEDVYADDESYVYEENIHSPLDPESSCSDSEEEEFRNQRHLLSYPIRLIGAAIQCSPELLSSAKELIEQQKENLLVRKRKLLLETKLLELKNAKLSLEVKNLEKTLDTTSDQTTTFYLQS